MLKEDSDMITIYTNSANTFSFYNIVECKRVEYCHNKVYDIA